MSQRIAKCILPFSTLSPNRIEPFTQDIERAAVFCLAELERGKGEGLVLKQPDEKLSFIAEVCYPFWRVTLGKTNLLFDGLSVTSHSLTYLTIPDSQAFLDSIGRSSTTRQAYMAFLSDNRNYFQTTGDTQTKKVDGLITDPEFVQEFLPFLSEAKPLQAPLSDAVVISPTIDEASIASTIKHLQDMKSKFSREVDLLYTSMKLVNTNTGNFLGKMRDKTKKVEEELSNEIRKYRTSTMKETEELRKEYNEKVTEHSQKAEENLLVLHQEKIKLEKAREQLTRELERCEAEIKTCAVSKDDVGEREWREKRTEFRSNLSENEAGLKELDRQIKAMEDEKKLRILRLKSELEANVKEVTKDLVEIESSREAKIRFYQEEMEKLEELTAAMIQQIDKLAKQRERFLEEFDRLGVPQGPKIDSLIYMPFYMACYQSGSGKRYVNFPPSIVNSISFSVKIKGALRRSRIKQLLQPRCKALPSLLNKLPLLMERDAVFNRGINEACAEANILQTKESRELLKIGLERLKEEGWFSYKDFESFKQTLT